MVHRRQRLRRLILDEAGQMEVTQAPQTAATNSKPRLTKKKETRVYAVAATRRHQRKTTDLIPKRLLPYAMVVFLLLISVGVLNLSASLAEKWAHVISDEATGALSLWGTGSISGWFSSFLLILTGLASLQIYALRQHRNDDYRGTYRLWLWMAGLFVIASMNCVVDFEAVASALASFFFEGGSARINGWGWWLVAIKMVALTALVVRGLLEVRASQSAFAMVVVVWVAYTASIVMQIPQFKNMTVMNHETVYGNCNLAGTVLLLLAVLTYARQVFLQANGLIKIAAKKAKTVARSDSAATKSSSANPKAVNKPTVQSVTEAKKSTESAKTPVTTKKDPSAALPKQKGLTSPLAAKMESMNCATRAANADLNNDEADEILQLRDKKVLNKAERRRLKKLQQRQHQRRAA